MTEDEILSELEIELKDKFPDLVTTDNKGTFDVMQKVLLDFIIPFQNEEMFVYMKSREKGKSLALHIADIPTGVDSFEDWFNSGLLTFASNILNSLQSTLAKDKVYLTFAHLLDSKDLKEFFERSDFNEVDEEKLSGMLAPFLSDSELDLFLQALSCIYVGLDNSAKSLLKLWIQALWFDGDDIQKTLDNAKAILAIREHSSKAGKQGAKTRWGGREKTQCFAIDLMLSCTFKNPNQAASEISEEVIAYGKSVGFNFSNNFQAQKTIYEWLRKHVKNES